MSDKDLTTADVPISVQSTQGIIVGDTDAVENSVGVHPIPGMFFDKAGMSLGLKFGRISITSMEAVSCCRLTPMSGSDSLWTMINPVTVQDPEVRGKYMNQLKVQHSESWSASRNSSESIPTLVSEHDWTYTCTYWGSVIESPGSRLLDEKHGSECSSKFLPMALLSDTSKPVVLYKEVWLWEDELEDNGFSRCSVRLRVMHDFTFILLKFELRVDGVLDSRSIETRFFYHYSDHRLLRDFKWIENGNVLTELSTQQVYEI